MAAATCPNATADDRPGTNKCLPTNMPSEKQSEVPIIQFVDGLRELEKEEDPEVAEFFRLLVEEGTLTPGDSGVPMDDRPSWLDEDKLRRGQQFAQKYYVGISVAGLLSLFLLFASPDGLGPLIFSGNSDTARKAGRRYLSTARRVRAWYRGDLWAAEGDAGRHLRAVRHLHATYRRRLRDASPEERARRMTLQPPLLLTQGVVDAVKRDFAPQADAFSSTMCPFLSAVSLHHEWLNQMEMSITQWGFLGLMTSYPGRFGAGGASDAELDDFLHLWRAIGHLLGVHERFNFCVGGLDAVRKRSRALLRRFQLPSFAHVGDAWEHMARCVFEGSKLYAPPMDFQVALLYLCETVGAETPRVLQSLNAHQRREHRMMTWMMQWGLRVGPLRALLNWRLNRLLDNAQPPPPEDDAQADVTVPERKGSRHSFRHLTRLSAYLVLAFLAANIVAVIWAAAMSE